MKKIICVLLLNLICFPVFAYTSWENSPNNWDNSVNNFANSPNNFANSPNNWNNSVNNPKANIIYDNNGNPQGYAVPKSSGTEVNVYDFNGNRQGYYNY